jgi:ABC-2 type transport system permease protein
MTIISITEPRTTNSPARAAPAWTVRPVSTPGLFTASGEVALRAVRKYFRTPGLFVMGLVQSAGFLFIFRYVFGGAVQAGTARYVDYLVPGYVATLVLFTGGGVAVAVAEDRDQGFTPRLLSLPVPRLSIVAGRAVADFLTTMWSLVFTTAFGFLIGFRLPGPLPGAATAAGLCLAYGLAFTIAFIVIGLYAPSAQAAQGMSMIAFVLAFVSSTYVPATSMPGWLQPFAKYQPISPMVDAVRSALVGSSHDVALALLWTGGLIAVFIPVAVVRCRRP